MKAIQFSFLLILAAMGVNTIVFEVDYKFAFASHPELRRGKNPITEKGARMLGHLFTTWSKVDLKNYQPLIEGLKLITED